MSKLAAPARVSFFQRVKAPDIQLTTGAAAGRVLQSDASGFAAWVDQWRKDGAVSGLWTDVNHVTVGGTTGSELIIRNNDSGTGLATNAAYNSVILRPHVATNGNWAAIAGYSASDAIAADVAFRFVDHSSHYADIVFSTRNAASGYTHRDVD